MRRIIARHSKRPLCGACGSGPETASGQALDGASQHFQLLPFLKLAYLHFVLIPTTEIYQGATKAGLCKQIAPFSSSRREPALNGVWEGTVPRFFFHLKSKESLIPDESGKYFDSLDAAYEHGRKLIDNILQHVGHDDANAWKVIVSTNEDDVQLIIPFAISYFSARREFRNELSLKTSPKNG